MKTNNSTVSGIIGSSLLFAALILFQTSISAATFGHAFFEKVAPNTFKWGIATVDNINSVSSWNTGYADNAATFDEQVRVATDQNRNASRATHIHLGTGTWNTRGLSTLNTDVSGLFQDNEIWYLTGNGAAFTTLTLVSGAPYNACVGLIKGTSKNHVFLR